MKLRTINPVPKANILFNQDCKVVARIPEFNLVNFNFEIVYDLEVPYEPAPGEAIQTRIVKLKNFREKISMEEVNAVLSSFDCDLNENYNYAQNMQAALHEAFRIKLGIDGKFGLTADDWEKI